MPQPLAEAGIEPVVLAEKEGLALINGTDGMLGQLIMALADLQHLLTSEEGLTSAPIAHLQLMEQGSTHDALAQGVTPPLLVAEDHIHLNGWGNLLVSWAIGQRMRELRWI